MGVVLGGVALVLGVLIGLSGVGGVLLPPSLVAIAGMPVHEATATSAWAFIFTGLVGTVAFTSRGVVPVGMLWRLAIGAVPGAFAGALLNSRLPAGALLVGLALLTLAVGANELLPGRRHLAVGEPGTTALVVIGALIGLGSALTGTGGPVLLVPVLLVLGVDTLPAVAVSQVIQLPVVVTASIGFWQLGQVDVRLGTLLGLAAGAGAAAGAVLATRVDAERLRAVVGGACLVAGVCTLARLVA